MGRGRCKLKSAEFFGIGDFSSQGMSVDPYLMSKLCEMLTSMELIVFFNEYTKFIVLHKTSPKDYKYA